MQEKFLKLTNAVYNVLDFLDWSTINSSYDGAVNFIRNETTAYPMFFVPDRAEMGCGGFGALFLANLTTGGVFKAQSGGLFAGGGGVANNDNSGAGNLAYLAGSGGSFGGGGGGANSYDTGGYPTSGAGGSGGIFIAVTEYA
jgi:hypothetical protein